MAVVRGPSCHHSSVAGDEPRPRKHLPAPVLSAEILGEEFASRSATVCILWHCSPPDRSRLAPDRFPHKLLARPQPFLTGQRAPRRSYNRSGMVTHRASFTPPT